MTEPKIQLDKIKKAVRDFGAHDKARFGDRLSKTVEYKLVEKPE